MEKETRNQELENIVSAILADYKDDRIINRTDISDQPDRDNVNDILGKIIKLIFPGYIREKNYKFYNLSSRLTVLTEDIIYNLKKQIAISLIQKPEFAGAPYEKRAEVAGELTGKFMLRIPAIREYAETDVQAFFEGDPAAYNHSEIILCYPGLRAIITARIAHELYALGVPLIPRMMTEHAHSRTGIDIHPGATIGKYFFIDHGTGIVIGETTIIGDYVKIYQGVTIGALSTRGGQTLRGVKRHPTIEDRVTIYAGASILGGETVIGHDAIIGSNTFITSSVEPGGRVSFHDNCNCPEN
ncbi:MAG: serine acetyltransferase [Lachnospiraceae bacterium]|nr:serine acetyltransferase [Lachnospiraceae bacterium]MBO7096246.1 serine acetyltransferase [Lachnospiraceae bacterium]MBO7363169.1 serine acetyltransferase [Lachnospiraceae bacterium]MBO7531589.1 serine acetyltransferase [Lachnospiraceae bacterium]MBP5252240.1 serine acetyltransferase [Lachnospiraceae bacterium]